jgi:hypothetical protein
MPARHPFFKFLVSGCAAAGALLIVNNQAATRILAPKPGFGIERAYDVPRLPEPRNRFLNDTADPAVRYNNLSGNP